MWFSEIPDRDGLVVEGSGYSRGAAFLVNTGVMLADILRTEATGDRRRIGVRGGDRLSRIGRVRVATNIYLGRQVFTQLVGLSGIQFGKGSKRRGNLMCQSKFGSAHKIGGATVCRPRPIFPVGFGLRARSLTHLLLPHFI